MTWLCNIPYGFSDKELTNIDFFFNENNLIILIHYALFILSLLSCGRQGITLGPCLLHLHIWASNFSILAYKFSLHMFISKDNKFESDNIKFRKSFSAETGKLEGSNMWVYKTGP